MAKDFSTMGDSNRSANPSIHDLSDPARRLVLQGGLGALAASLVGCATPAGSASLASAGPIIGFKPVPISTALGTAPCEK